MSSASIRAGERERETDRETLPYRDRLRQIARGTHTNRDRHTDKEGERNQKKRECQRLAEREGERGREKERKQVSKKCMWFVQATIEWHGRSKKTKVKHGVKKKVVSNEKCFRETGRGSCMAIYYKFLCTQRVHTCNFIYQKIETTSFHCDILV